jgi:hypothetical protein
MMQDTPWDHGLKVTGEGEGLVGHAGVVLLRKLADRAGLTAVRLRGPQGRRAGHAALPAAEPARPARPPRPRPRPQAQPHLALERPFLACWQRLCALPEPA